jgi:hypothetical protein
MKRCALKHDYAAAFVVLGGGQLRIGSYGWHYPNRFPASIGRRFDIHVVRLQSICGVQERLRCRDAGRQHAQETCQSGAL